ncbi:hypothetical protein GKIL_2823 [Gloeobacter kilaueensis JS1]|uniref:Uncharacterized protein n=1 Tax=Gloeobacter kilaueensis (strain ATCC BAA-2537 / CCAP 1431/1 / ULC 316 / JS1) TaxID=1183438 RepID=U5QN85_GLOK1|nr:hypothetical protein GKIL_2823 [Gloeobacter kilaueensis JS1]
MSSLPVQLLKMWRISVTKEGRRSSSSLRLLNQGVGLSTQRDQPSGPFLLFIKIDTGVFLFLFDIEPVMVGDYSLQVINGEPNFERTFLTAPQIKRTACDLVAQVASGQQIELPVLLGEWEPNAEINGNWQQDLNANRLPQVAG